MKKYITITISILLLITITTPFTVNAKTAKETLLENVVTTKDGLYKDEYEEGRYIYKGENPNNYITFNNEYAGWRIISVEKDGTIKIIKNQSIGKMIFDDGDNGTYCDNDTYGCNVWASTNNMVGQPEIFKFEYEEETYGVLETITKSGNVLEDSDINKYLNNIYYNSISNQDKNNIKMHTFYIGGTQKKNIETMIQNEKSFQWKGNIGLINYTDFLRTVNNNKTWIKRGYTLTPQKDVFSLHLSTTEQYYWHDAYTVYDIDIYPVTYLDSSITLTGSGTQDNPYTIESEVTINLETFGDLDKDLQFKLDTAGKTLSEIKEEIDNQIGTKIEKDGECCTLDSWYLDKDLKNRFDEDTQINNNLTLFGRWECRETETVNVPDTLLQIPNWIINLGCSITIIGILLIVFIIRKKNTRNEE